MLGKNGEIIPHGSLITWNVWDSDDFKTWTMYGVLHDYTQLQGVFHREDKFVVYLGGGIDFGEAIGKKLSFEEIEQDADNNDENERGVTRLGTAMDVVRVLSKAYSGQ